MSEATETWVPSPLPVAAGSRVAGLAEALRAGALTDTTDGETETTSGEREGAVTPDVTPGMLITQCGLLGPWVRGHGRGLGPGTRLALRHPPGPSQCPDVAQLGSQQLRSEAKQTNPSKGSYLLEATERGHGHPTHCRGSSAEGLPT